MASVDASEKLVTLASSQANYDTLPRQTTWEESVAVEGDVDDGDDVERRRAKEKKVLLAALIFCFVFMVLELASGIIAHSLALLTDAIHLMTDVGAYALSIAALVAAGRGACGKYNYGWHRAEVIGTLISIFSIWALVLWIVTEAFYRMYDIYMCSREQGRKQPPSGGNETARQCTTIDSRLMVIVGTLGLAVNICCASILYFGGSHGHSHFGGSSHGHSHGEGADHGHDHNADHDHGHSHGEGAEHGHDHNADHDHDHSHSEKKSGFAINAALLHALGDGVQSVGVILAGLLIYVANQLAYGTHSYRYSVYNLADPLCSVLFAIVTLNMTKPLIGDLLGILMESTPPRVDYDALEAALRRIEGVESVHDLHVWSLSADYVALSVHLVADDANNVLHKAKEACLRRFGIDHTTIQVDSSEHGSTKCTGSCSSPTGTGPSF